MYTILLVTHIVMMIASMGLMSGAIVLGLFGKHSAVTTATVGEIATVMGGLTGTLLLLGAPLSIQCALLAAYLIAITALYVFGFGMGHADDARFVRAK